jgi:hypothetical protein
MTRPPLLQFDYGRIYFTTKTAKKFAADFMKNLMLLGLSTLLLAGCATSTVETRKQERYAAYSALPPETRQIVDQGHIKVGLPMDAVYIAWGPPSQEIHGESSEGPLTTWRYFGTTMEEYRFWNYHTYIRGRRVYSAPSLDFDYYPRSYLQAEVSFVNGLVKNWHTAGSPPRY